MSAARAFCCVFRSAISAVILLISAWSSAIFAALTGFCFLSLLSSLFFFERSLLSLLSFLTDCRNSLRKSEIFFFNNVYSFFLSARADCFHTEITEVTKKLRFLYPGTLRSACHAVECIAKAEQYRTGMY